ncbi:MAG: hypothetical protein ACLS4Z_00300 [Christensenellaceae bacterium]
MFSTVPAGEKGGRALSFGGYDKNRRQNLLLGLSLLIIATDSVMILALNGVLRSYGGERGDELISAATIMLSFMQIITLPSAEFRAAPSPPCPIITAPTALTASKAARDGF